jgi:hypothetical protein
MASASGLSSDRFSNRDTRMCSHADVPTSVFDETRSAQSSPVVGRIQIGKKDAAHVGKTERQYADASCKLKRYGQ